MQLSLPIPAFPTAPVSQGGNNNASSADPALKNAGESAGDSFESLLPKKTPAPADKGEEEEEGTDAEKSADILAASFWMPMVQGALPPPSTPLSLAVDDLDPTAESAMPSTDTTGKAAEETGGAEISRPSISFGFKSSRAFVATGTDTAAAASRAAVRAATAPVAELAGAPSAQQKVEPLPEAPAETLAKGLATDAATQGVAVEIVQEGSTPNPVISPASREPADAGLEKETARAEKIAASQPLSDDVAKIPDLVREKYFLDTANKHITKQSPDVGIDVAKVSDTMPAAAPVRTKADSISEVASAFAVSGESRSVATFVPEAPVPVATVRETMTAVITAIDTVERRAEMGQKMVELQFHVGEERLGLRVELRDGVVHTTFRTESSEMNRALAREWQAVVQPAAAREVRLAEPVFNSSGSHNQSASGSLGQGAQQHRDQTARTSFSSTLKGEFYDSSVSDSTASASPAANSSQLLNVLA